MEEVNEITLSWLEKDICRELTDSQLLDDFKHIQFLVELLTAICPEPVFTLLLGPEAAAARTREILEAPETAVLVGEDTPCFNLSLQLVFLVVLVRVLGLLIIVANELLLLIIFCGFVDVENLINTVP